MVFEGKAIIFILCIVGIGCQQQGNDSNPGLGN